MPSQLRVAINDITERVQAVGALKRSERVLNDFFDQSSIGLVWLDPDGCILRINQAQLDLLGCRREEALGSRIVRYHENPDGAEDLLRRLNRGESLHNHKDRLHRRDGTVRVVLIDANAQREDGRIAHSLWFVRDITERTELEQDVLKATDFEQQRIARDLHDDLGQYLTGLVHVNNALRQQLTGTRHPAADLANRLAKLLKEAGDKVRALAYGLQPVPPDSQGLMTALSGLADYASSQFKIDCRLLCPDPVLIEETTTANHLFRIAQEAVNNALKHSHAKTIEISLARTPREIHLSIRNDGRRLPARHAESRGMGLRIMKYRAGVIGGFLEIRPALQGGTSVVCSVRLPSSEP